MKGLLIFFIYSLFLSQSYSQQKTFSKVLYTEQGELKGSGIAQSTDSGYLIIGWPKELVKINSLGEVIWSKSLSVEDSENYSSLYFKDIISTHDSCYYIIGGIYSKSEEKYECIYLKSDDDGKILLSKILYDEQALNPQTLEEFADSSIIIGGYAGNLESSQAFLAKINKYGDFEWFKKENSLNRHSKCIRIKKANKSFFASITVDSTSIYESDGSLINMDLNGNVNWAKRYKIKNGSESEIPDLIVNDSSLNIYLDSDKTIILEAKLNGQVIWNESFWEYNEGWDDSPKSNMTKLSENSFAYCYSDPANGGGISIFDAEKNKILSKHLELIPVKLFETKNKEYFIFGYGPIFGVKSTNHISYATGIIQIDSLGYGQECVNDDYNGATENDTIIDIDINYSFITGGNTKRIQIRKQELNVLSKDGCVDYTGSSKDAKGLHHCNIYPNPSEGILNIELFNAEDVSISIYNSLGATIIDQAEVRNNESIDISNQAPGIYFYKLSFNNKELNNGTIILK